MSNPGVKRKLAAIVAADVVGYSRLVAEGEEGTLSALQAHRAELIEPSIAEHRGRVANTAGDSVLIEFPSVVEALRCAIDVQRGMAERNSEISVDRRIAFRIGVNLGDVVEQDGDLLGDGVNLAARLEALAEAGGICASDDVVRQVRGKLDLNFNNGGLQEVKNITAPVQVWHWSMNDEASSHTDSGEHAPARPEKPSIAVLPFDNMSGDPEQEYFSDGLTEDIIASLSRFGAFFVFARNSSFAYKGQFVDVKRIGRDLGARYVLEGSVRKAGDRVRVTAQLVDALDATSVWARQFDRQITDIFAIQDEITHEIASAIEPEIYVAESKRGGASSNDEVDTWIKIARAQAHIYRWTPDDIDAAEQLAGSILESDGEVAAASRIAAWCRYVRSVNGWCRDRGAMLRSAAEPAREAVSTDPADGQNHFVLGAVSLGLGEHDRAITALERALEINPSLALAHAFLGMTLTYAGRPGEALAKFDRAFQVSPRDENKSSWRCAQALTHLMLGELQEAERWARYSVERRPDWLPSHTYLAAALAMMDELEDAQRALQNLLEVAPGFTVAKARRAHPFRHDVDFERLAQGLRKAGLPD